jgi:arylsulfatase A-like enzyme
MTRPANRPNVVLILADDMGFGDLSCYRQDPANVDAPTFTPHIDALAAGGVKFTNAYSQPMCSPARAALLTGRYPQRFGVYGNHDVYGGLPRDVTLLPELMKQAGYATACVGKWHLGHVDGGRPLDRGFERFYGFLGASHDFFKPDIGTDTDGAMYQGSWVWDQDKKVESIKYMTTQLTDVAIDFIDSAQKQNKPFFLYLAYNAPHGPHQAEEQAIQELGRYPHVKNKSRTVVRAMIDSLDQNVGRIQRELFLRGIADDTIIIFASDNGGDEYEQADGLLTVHHNGGLRGRKFTLYEGGIRVPMIVRWTSVLPEGKVYDKPALLLDAYRTIANAAGAAVPRGQTLDSVDVVPFLTAKGDANRVAADAPHPMIYSMMPGNDVWAIRRDDWKLIQDFDSTFVPSGPRGPTILGLYNLANDPWERNNLLESNPEKAKELRAAIDAFRAECAPSLADQRKKGS